MNKCRLRFSKLGRAVWISHLDLMRTMQRSLMRAGVPLEYSRGFNPHAVMSIALPLPVGMESVCELMDFTAVGSAGFGELLRRINDALPEGIRGIEIYGSEAKFNDIEYLRFSGTMQYRIPGDDLCDRLRELFGARELVIDKKTKRGVNKADIAPLILKEPLNIRPSGRGIELEAVIRVPEMSPAHFMEAIRQHRPELYPMRSQFRREELLCRDLSRFS